MKTPRFVSALFALGLVFGSPPPAADAAQDLEFQITETQVTELVKVTCASLAKDAPGTIAAINRGDAPYKDAANPTLYVFVYDPEVRMVAHPRAELVGQSFQGKPDVKGKLFRDEIVERAMKDGTGWVFYLYQKPGGTGVFPKMTFFTRVVGGDGKPYVVCAGKYKS